MKATYIDHMGTDLSVVNAARVSFGKESDWVRDGYEDEWGYIYDFKLSQADQKLISFLARGCTSDDWGKLVEEVGGLTCWDCYHDVPPSDEEWELLENTLNHIRKMPPHWSPFAHTAISIHLKMPIFVARQIMKHSTGFVFNEVSRRYVDSEPELFTPEVWRKRAGNVKQGSSDVAVDDVFGTAFMVIGENTIRHAEDRFNRAALNFYRDLLDHGVAPEQARMVLPQSMYTEVITTANLYAWATMFNQRTDSHAQKETQTLALQIGEIIQPLFPVSWKELTR